MEKEIEISRPIDQIIFNSHRYSATRIEIDSTGIDKPIAFITDGFTAIVASKSNRQIFSIKGVDTLNYIASSYDFENQVRRYFVYVADRNEGEQAIVDAWAKILTDKEAEVLRKEKAERQFILDNPWPYKTVFGGEAYTRTTDPQGKHGVGVDNYGEKIGETTYLVPSQEAYPKDFVWQEGYSLLEKGAPIHAIKGIDTKYYILVWGYIYVSDKYHDAAIDQKVKEMSHKSYAEVERAMKWYSLEDNLKRDFFTPNTAKLLADNHYPLSSDYKLNENLQITSVWIYAHDYVRWKQFDLPEGFFEIAFGMYDARNKYSPYTNNECREINFYKKEQGEYVLTTNEKLNFRLESFHYNNEYYHKLYSQLVDNQIADNAQLVADAQNIQALGYITLGFANGTFKKMRVSDVSQPCIDAFTYLLALSIYEKR